jgi:hypothetical protein
VLNEGGRGVSEHDWVTSESPEAMLLMAEPIASKRKLRLLVCACCRGIWPALCRIPEVAEGVEIAERHADGLASAEQLGRAHAQIVALRGQGLAVGRLAKQDPDRYETLRCGEAACGPLTAGGLGMWLLWEGLFWRPGEASERRLAGLFRDLFDNPFRPSPLSADVLSWQGGTVAALARAASDERRMPEGTLDPAALAVLADALEDAGGGADAAFVAHLREPGARHYRGCWVVDRLLGKGSVRKLPG